MRKTLLLLTLCFATFLFAQNPETNSRNFTVTKLANTNQLVSYPNEITYGPDGWLWITERSALDNTSDATNGERIVRVHPDTGAKTVMIDLHNDVDGFDGQDGLMGMAIHPDLMANANTSTNNFVYAAHTYGTQGNLKLKIIKMSFNNSNKRLTKVAGSLIENIDASNDHNSGRMKIGPDGKLYYTIGDLGWNQFRNKCSRIQSQALPTQNDVDNENWYSYKGKVLRMNLDGSIPTDNPKFFPFTVTDSNPVPSNSDTNRPDSEKVRSHIYSYGHRNAQGIVFDSTGKLYQSEHGDRVDDEVNIITAGKNYGWPLIVGQRDAQAYDYCIKASDPNGCSAADGNSCPSGSTIHQETAFPEPIDFQSPIATYVDLPATRPTGGFLTWPTVAPASIDVYESNIFPWNKSILIPTLKKGTIYRYELSADGNSVVSELIEFHSSNDRYRDVAISPDGSTIYAVTDSGGSTSGPSGTSNVGVTNPGAVFKIQYQAFPEPSNQVTNFNAQDNGNTIDLSWNDAIGGNTADGYAIAVSTTAGSFPTYIDGQQPNNDLDLSDGDGLVLVPNGEESYTFEDLADNTTYYFQITAYSNLAKDIDFLLSPVAPEASATTTISLEPTIIITEVVSNSIPEAYVEIFNYGTLPVDLATEGFYLGIAYDGSGVTGNDIDLTVTLQPGQYYTIGRASGSLNPDLTAWNVINGSGNDAYVLYNGDDEIVDIYGALGQNGNGQPWEYSNSRAVRKITVAEASNTWQASEWIIETISNFNDVTAGEGENIDFTYNNSWSPYDPSGSSYQAENAVIQNGSATLSDMTLFKNVTINSGATLVLNNSGLNITEDLQNNGSLNDSNGILELSGDSNQQINGNDFEISRLIISNSAIVSVDVSIKNVLDVNDDLTIAAMNQMILKSNDSGTAYVDEVNGNISGTFMVENYIPGKRSFRFMSPSVTTNNFIANNWQSDFGSSNVGTHITGSISGANGFDATGSGNVSMFTFDNTNQSWTPINNTDATNLIAGDAYRLFVRGDRTIDLSNNASTANNTTLKAVGNIATGNVTVNDLSPAAGGFNFIGNPYQAPVDLNQVLTAATNMNTSFVYYWDPAINTRGAYVTVDVLSNSSNNPSSLMNKYVQPNTSFFATTLANGPASLTFTEANKAINSGFLNSARSSSTLSRIEIALYESSEFQDGENSRDGAVIRFDSNQLNVVNSYDAVKFNNIDENLSIINGVDNLSIEQRNLPQDSEVIPLDINTYRATDYVLSFNLSSINVPVYLKDNYLSSYTPLNDGSNNYHYSVVSGNALSVASNRFELVFSNTVLSLEEIANTEFSVYPNPLSNNEKIFITGSLIDNVKSIALYNMLGQKIQNWSNINNVDNSLEIDLENLRAGNYILQINHDSGSDTKQLIVK
ncbi:PQQ-dependent dehydrogenase (s-GDH family) [Nonlabens dokdonensis]|uniref:LTD domain-containing protein n=2 Tax=Nonlabens dokdonensis TaxID=328515 RepID=L7WEB4_NONDD|nr:PQQ-dependent sugar dehydrogenase [Nonlabens dokdonensis]AGC78627.1 uncharacterized protein DDD_3500 [Nonlabens dokdonensis DSW-6]PZX39244.1 PQQ-dependent dehydrogenase (s-GDH family) [Nonlabens dokdonensis]